MTASGHAVVPLTLAQIDEFAGNAIEVEGTDGRYLVMSTRARNSLTESQRSAVAEHLTILDVEVPTIELAGGSIRCMIAGIHLPRPEARA
ncbi:arginine deiminase-related protein [Streptosporangium sp. NPDC006013]|uniref:arginine deiminase-related protein n=1 Tax=unclassified Streptosporangium TaxID=2632669 RepID=UPI0033B0AE21